MKVDGVDWRWASIYVALNHTRDQIISEGLANIIPFRVTKNGRQYNGTYPTVKTVYEDQKNEQQREQNPDEAGTRWKWHRDPKQYKEEDRRRILGKVVESLTIATFKNHFYKWDNQIRKQKTRGAIA